MTNKDTEKYNWSDHHAWMNGFGDYGYHHGFNSRGIAPSFLGSDSLPQGLADLHWALHGVQGNMDQLDAKMKTFEDNISKIANDMKDDVIKHLADKLAGSKTPLTTETGYISKMLTTRTRIFSDSFGPETQMPIKQRIRGFTENYNWIQYTQKNTTCEGEYDKIIDFNFVADHQQNDGVDSLYVTKGKITLDKVGLINRVYITQHNTNMVIWYLLTQAIPSQTGVSYTGAIKRVEYDRNANLVSEGFISTNHTPLIFLGAFNGDANNEKDFIQYISTDYKVYQNHQGTDKELGKLPNDIIMMIDPVNDIISDSKQAYIIKYTNDGHIKFPLEGFTLIDTVDAGSIMEKFKKIEFSNDTELFKSFVSISPRNQTTLTKVFDPNKELVVEGGYYIELYDDNTTTPEVSASHIFLLSSTEEVYDLDRFASNIFNYHSDAPSLFSFKRERDYMEFNQITFYSGLTKMFPEIKQDFGIGDVPFTVKFDHSNQTEIVTIDLPQPFILERSLATREVNSRLGYTVLQNSDYVKDVGSLNTLAVYNKLDFVNNTEGTQKYINKLPKYDEAFNVPKWLRYRVVKPANTETAEGETEVTYFDNLREIKMSFKTDNGSLLGNPKYNENYTSKYKDSTSKISPTVSSEYLSELINSNVIYLEGRSSHRDKPYGSSNYTLFNETTGARVTQRLVCSNSGVNDITRANSLKDRVINIEKKKKKKTTVTKVWDRATKVNSHTFTLPVQYSETSSTEESPMSFVFIIDGSSSFSSKFKSACDHYIYVINNGITNSKSNIMIQLYKENTPDSYAATGVNHVETYTGMSSVLITKAQAIDLLNRLKQVKTPIDKGTTNNTYNQYSVALAREFGNLGFTTTDSTPVPFEQVFERQPNKHREFSVLQFTDGWIEKKESIDTTYVAWAKGAKTFMSIVNRNKLSEYDTNSNTSIDSMRAVGHPNIYEMTGKADSVVNTELLKRFRETAVTIINKKVIPTHVTISRSELPSGIASDVVLKKGGVTIPLNKNASTMLDQDMEAGTYTIEVTLSGTVQTSRSLTVSIASKTHNHSFQTELLPKFHEETTVEEIDDPDAPTSETTKTKAKFYGNVPVEETIFTRTIIDNKVGEWFGTGNIVGLKYLGIPGTYDMDSVEDGEYFGSVKPNHDVFTNIIARKLTIDALMNNMTHIIYRITNDVGLSMEYHNIAIREDRDDKVGYTSRPYSLLYPKWIPGDYVGNEEHPYPPDFDQFSKELLRRISRLEVRDIQVEDTNTIDLTKSGDWKQELKGTWDPVLNRWGFPDNDVTLSASVKLSTLNQSYTIDGQSYDLGNSIKELNDGLYSPDYTPVITGIINDYKTFKDKVNNSMTLVENILKSITKDLTTSGAWNPEGNTASNASVELKGTIKDGVHIAYGNINHFSGESNSEHYIRTSKTNSEHDTKIAKEAPKPPANPEA